MAAPTTGAVVLVSFPFSDLSQVKLRPAVVLAEAGRGDLVLCQITSNAYADPRAVLLLDTDFRHGSLNAVSYARPGKLFTASQSLITAQVGMLKQQPFERVLQAVIDLLESG